MAEFPSKTTEDWRELAAGEAGGRPVEELVWRTPEGIAVNAKGTVVTPTN